MYSASVVDRLHCVCNFDCHTIGQPAYSIKNPVRDFAVLASSSNASLFYPRKFQVVYFCLVLVLYPNL